MTPKAASFTPLESLLFFQSLRDQDLSAIDFGKISDGLLALPIIQHGADDRAHLSPAALRDLYLELVQREAQHHKSTLQNGERSPASRKRKSPSPKVPTLEEAAKHRYLLPHLVLRLYASYREKVVASIKQDEQEIANLEEELQSAEESAPGEQGSTNGQAKVKANGDKSAANGDISETTRQESADVQVKPDTADSTAGSSRPASARASIASLVNLPPEPPAASQKLPNDAKGASVPLPHEMAPEQVMQPPAIPNQPNWQNQRPRPGQQPSPHLKQVAPYPGPFQHQGHGQSPPSQHSQVAHSPSSPNKQLPMPAKIGMQTPPVPQAGFQHRPPMQPQYASPVQGRSPAPAGRGYAPPPYQHYQAPQYQQYPHMPPYAPQPQYQILPSQQGGFQLPPFQVAAQPAPQPTPQRQQYAQAHRAPQSPYNASSPFPPLTPQHVRAPPDDDLTKSVVASLRKRRSTSTWKALGLPSISVPGSPTRPPVEPISPIRPNLDLDLPDAPEEKKSRTRKRGNSIASSAIASSTRGRTRSQSTVSHAADPGTAATRSTCRATKTESTPQVEPRPDDSSAPSQTRTRNRRATQTNRPSILSDRAPPMQSLQASRRPRERRDVVHATRNFARLSNVILNEIAAHRHAGPFAKPVSDREVEGYSDIVRRPMDLKRIKAAVTAGGKVVNAAAKAQQQAEVDSTDISVGADGIGAGDNSATITLPKTESVVPPLGVVNGAQLEKEVMRTFANAVMFNSGHDGIVQDARDMAEDIAVSIAKWRGIEANLGLQGAASTSGAVEDDEAPVLGKRRRL